MCNVPHSHLCVCTSVHLPHSCTACVPHCVGTAPLRTNLTGCVYHSPALHYVPHPGTYHTSAMQTYYISQPPLCVRTSLPHYARKTLPQLPLRTLYSFILGTVHLILRQSVNYIKSLSCHTRCLVEMAFVTPVKCICSCINNYICICYLWALAWSWCCSSCCWPNILP